MSKMMTVIKLEGGEVKSVRDMLDMWLDDDEIEENSGGMVSVEDLEILSNTLPYVEPDQQPLISTMISFFDSDENILPDRVYDELNKYFG